ncbi:hypothetical protein SDC9_202354 [bioreactor metagenome]|uniref:Uncharacterized protein n=1 Tax=bioreactor metagenome TaxID=1076179 RepID=A0A645IU44_9ZZZZ
MQRNRRFSGAGNALNHQGVRLLVSNDLVLLLLDCGDDRLHLLVRGAAQFLPQNLVLNAGRTLQYILQCAVSNAILPFSR